MLYGYKSTLFTVAESTAANIRWVAGSVTYPFLVVEFKGDGGSMYAATNQCLGGAAVCVNLAEDLNRRVVDYHSVENRVHDDAAPAPPLVNSAAFSVAVNASLAQSYVSWKDGDTYLTQKVRGFAVQEPDHFIQFRQFVRSVLDWGEIQRLEEVLSALAYLQAVFEKRIAEAKSRPRPESPSPTRAKRGRSSSAASRGSSRAGHEQHTYDSMERRFLVVLTEQGETKLGCIYPRACMDNKQRGRPSGFHRRDGFRLGYQEVYKAGHGIDQDGLSLWVMEENGVEAGLRGRWVTVYIWGMVSR